MAKKISAKLGLVLTALMLIISILAFLSLNGSFAWFANNKSATAKGFSVEIQTFSTKGTIACYGVLDINEDCLEYTVENTLDENGERVQMYELPLNDPNGITYSQYRKALLVCITVLPKETSDVVLTLETTNSGVTTEIENHLSNCIQITPADYDEASGIATRAETPSSFVTVSNNTCSKTTKLTLFSGSVTEAGQTLYYIMEYNEAFIDYINMAILESGQLASEETKYRNDVTFIIS